MLCSLWGINNEVDIDAYKNLQRILCICVINTCVCVFSIRHTLEQTKRKFSANYIRLYEERRPTRCNN